MKIKCMSDLSKERILQRKLRMVEDRSRRQLTQFEAKRQEAFRRYLNNKKELYQGYRLMEVLNEEAQELQSQISKNIYKVLDKS